MKQWQSIRGLLLLATGLCLASAGRAQAVQVRGVPFAATQVITRTSATGTTRTEGRIARNTDGSTYVEEVDPASGAAIRGLIVDVPGRRLITLDLVERLYVVREAPVLTAQTVPLGSTGEILRWAEAHRARAERQTEGDVQSIQTWLGTRQVNGLLTVGTMREQRPLETANGAAGPGAESTIGPDGTIRIDESWFSVDLKLPVLMTERRPATGETIEVQLTRILRTEPSASLFSVPSGFSRYEAKPSAPRTPVNPRRSDG